ncbi:hypothetical protein UE98_33200 [Burkholderia cenocepacia]|nr:hypothetical protein UE98_33200 [Burkholderia cenocepacia]
MRAVTKTASFACHGILRITVSTSSSSGGQHGDQRHIGRISTASLHRIHPFIEVLICPVEVVAVIFYRSCGIIAHFIALDIYGCRSQHRFPHSLSVKPRAHRPLPFNSGGFGKIGPLENDAHPGVLSPFRLPAIEADSRGISWRVEPEAELLAGFGIEGLQDDILAPNPLRADTARHALLELDEVAVRVNLDDVAVDEATRWLRHLAGTSFRLKRFFTGQAQSGLPFDCS